jgi:hypothetical protein
MIERLTSSSIRRMANEFEKLQNIPYVFGVVYGSHIPIIAPSIDQASYYCRNVFYLVLLQGVIDAKCKFWDFFLDGLITTMIGHCSKKL